MNIIIDIVLSAIVLIFGIAAYKKGLISSLLGLASSVISFLISGWLSNIGAAWIYQLFFHNNLVESLTDKLESVATATTASLQEALPPYVVKAADGLGIPLNSILENSTANANAHDIAESLVNGAVRPVTTFLIRVILFILIFIVILIATRFLVKLFKFVNKIPVIGSFNKTFGFLVGLVKGAVIVALICIVLNGILSFSGGHFLIFDSDVLRESYLYSFFNRFNPLV